MLPLQWCTLLSISRQLTRFYCSSKFSKLITVRTEQKQLYGAVVQKENHNESPPNVDDTSVTFSKYIAVKADISSEYHWLIQNRKQSKHVKVFKSNKSDNLSALRDKNPITNGKSKITNKSYEKHLTNLSPANKQSVILSAKNLLNEFIISNSNRKSINDITSLFDENSLRTITNYSIWCDKLSTKTELNEILLDNRLPSISKVLQATMPDASRQALERWKAAKIAELGDIGFEQYQQQTFEIGKQFHLAIETYLNEGHEPSPDSIVSNLWQSLGKQLKNLAPKPVLVEKQLIHPDLKYKGIIDNVSYVNNELCALEWKTSEKTKSTLISTYDAPIQLCAYIGALNVDPRYDIKIKAGYVVVAYKNGTAAHIFRLSDTDIRKYWSLWLSRLQEYWIRYRDGTLPAPI